MKYNMMMKRDVREMMNDDGDMVVVERYYDDFRNVSDCWNGFDEINKKDILRFIDDLIEFSKFNNEVVDIYETSTGCVKIVDVGNDTFISYVYSFRPAEEV